MPYPFYNQSALFPVSYQNPYGNGMAASPPPQQSMAQPQMKTMEWVEGEVGAKAFQMPAGLLPNQPIPLWDNTDTVIWIKSWNQFGVPNPMQKLRYEMPKETPVLPSSQSGATQQDMSNYVTKADLEQMKQDLIRSVSQNNQNGRQYRENRGENNGKPSV